jgi:hypothetical protein
MNKLCTVFPVISAVFLVPTGLSVILGKTPPKAHVGPHVAFPATKLSGRRLIFDVLFPDSFWKVLMVSVGTFSLEE